MGRSIIFCLCFLLSGYSVQSDEEWTAANDNARARVVIDVGGDEPEGSMGFGWSYKERDHVRTFRWIEHMEADVWFEREEVGEMKLRVEAAALHVEGMRQNIGVYINHAFITEWVCPDHHEFTMYHIRIPRQHLRPGNNRLTLRVGYRHRIERERRELGLAVERIVLESY